MQKIDLIIAGEKTVVQVFLLRLGNSRMPFVMIFPHQRQEAFFEGMSQAFIFWGGVPRSLTFDNLKTAVFKILKGKNRVCLPAGLPGALLERARPGNPPASGPAGEPVAPAGKTVAETGPRCGG